MSRFPDGTSLAAKLFDLRPADAAKNSRRLPDLAATQFWNPGGSGSVIVGSDGTYLLADTDIGWDRHLDDYVSGRRSLPETLFSPAG